MTEVALGGEIVGGIQIKVLPHRVFQYTPWEWPMTSVLFPFLKPGMTVYDCGAEEAELTAAVAKIVGGENVHIFEPSLKYWPNIKAVWDANELDGPGGCFQGFVADPASVSARGLQELSVSGWPDAINGEIHKEGAFCFVDERPDIPATIIDEYAFLTQSHPDVILMDIEGAEVLALKGAKETLAKGTTLFVSVHNETALAKYGSTREDLFELTKDYKQTYLGYDHEQHWRFDHE